MDGYHRGQKFIFVSDASNSKRSAQFDEESLHGAGCDILTTFASVVTTEVLMMNPE
ncbi:MAG TPA: hypothetical protein VI895_02485 [Bdellovibrionota bacterium]|nr:hypothetical protein [Bdellovibrionota bacterium]